MIYDLFSKEKIETIKSYAYEGFGIYKLGLSSAFKASFVLSLINTLIRAQKYSNSPYMFLIVLVDLFLSTLLMTIIWPIQLAWISLLPIIMSVLMIYASL